MNLRTSAAEGGERAKRRRAPRRAVEVEDLDGADELAEDMLEVDEGVELGDSSERDVSSDFDDEL